MKKLNVNNKLAFNKAAVTELNEISLQQINGGNSTIIGGENCTTCVCISALTKITIIK